MMKAYPAYKESGVEWLGDIPTHWNIWKLRNLFRKTSIKNRPDLPLLSVVREQGVIIRDVESKEENHNFIPDDLSKYKVLKRGQFVINKMKAWQGSYAVSELTGIVSPAYFIYDVDYSELLPSFFNLAIRNKSYVSFFNKASDGVRIGQWDLDETQMRDIPLFVPPLAEQAVIVTYLDKKCAEIDELMSRRQAIIERLKELKQSVIAEAVTKGLNPDVPKKDSGIKWIGKIPKHWNTEKINSFFRFGKGLSISKADLQEQGIPVISYGQIHSKNNKGVRETEELIRFIDNSYLVKSSKSLLHRNDILFADTSEDVKGIGNCVRISREGEIFAGYHTVIAFNKTGKDTKYWAYLFQSELWRNQLRQLTNGVKVFSISQKNLRKCLIINPPQNEQAMIVSYLDKKCAEIDTLISRQEQIIEKLKELKTSTIAHVVTGKVDVRDTL